MPDTAGPLRPEAIQAIRTYLGRGGKAPDDLDRIAERYAKALRAAEPALSRAAASFSAAVDQILDMGLPPHRSGSSIDPVEQRDRLLDHAHTILLSRCPKRHTPVVNQGWLRGWWDQVWDLEQSARSVAVGTTSEARELGGALNAAADAAAHGDEGAPALWSAVTKLLTSPSAVSGDEDLIWNFERVAQGSPVQIALVVLGDTVIGGGRGDRNGVLTAISPLSDSQAPQGQRVYDLHQNLIGAPPSHEDLRFASRVAHELQRTVVLRVSTPDGTMECTFDHRRPVAAPDLAAFQAAHARLDLDNALKAALRLAANGGLEHLSPSRTADVLNQALAVERRWWVAHAPEALHVTWSGHERGGASGRPGPDAHGLP